MGLEVPELAIGGVLDPVAVLARFEKGAGIADVQPGAPGDALRMPWLGLTVAGHGDDVEGHGHAVAERVAVDGREVAEDSAPDLPSLGAHIDRLGDVQAAVGPDRDLGIVAVDALVGERRAGRQHEEDQRQEGQQPLHPASPANALPTSGARRVSMPAEKKRASRNPNGPAMNRSGTC